MSEAEWVKVNGLNDGITTEEIVAHFQSARCGSGHVLRVVFVGNYGTLALVEIVGLNTNGKNKLYKGNHFIQHVKAKVIPGSPPSEYQLSEGTKYSVPHCDVSSMQSMPPLQDDMSDDFGDTGPIFQTGSGPDSSIYSPQTATPDLHSGQPLLKPLLTGTPVAHSSEAPHLKPNQASISPVNVSPAQLFSPVEESSKSDLALEQSVSMTESCILPDALKSPVVKVTGISPKWQDPSEYLSLAFDNEKMGGGEIIQDGITVKGDTALITFADPHVAERVSQKQDWKVMGINLRVALFESEGDPVQKLLKQHPLSSTILLDGIPPESDVDNGYLIIYIENITRLEDNDDFFIRRKDNQALMTLHDASTIEIVMDKIHNAKKALKGTRLNATLMQPVEGIHILKMKDEKCDQGFLELYFENEKKSGGGPVKHVAVIGRGEAIVTFEDLEVVKRVLLKPHLATLGESTVVHSYHPILTKWLDASKTTDIKCQSITQEAFCCNITPELYQYFEDSKGRLYPLNESLLDECALAELDCSNKDLCIHPKDGSEWDAQWMTKCNGIVSKFLSSFTEDSVPIPNADIAVKVFPVIMKHTRNPNALITLSDDQKHVNIVGMKEIVDQLKTTVVRIVRDNLDTMEDIELPLKVLVYVRDIVMEGLKQRHEEVIFEVNMETSKLHVSGKIDSCEAFLNEINHLQPVEVNAQLSPQIVRLLNMQSGMQFLHSKLRTDVRVSYYFVDSQGGIPEHAAPAIALCIVAEHQNAAMRVATALKNALSVAALTVPGEFQHTIMLDSWKRKRQEIENAYVAFIDVDLANSANQLQIACEKTYSMEIKRNLELFIGTECFAEVPIPLEKGQWEYLDKYSNPWKEFMKDLAKSSLEYSFPKKGQHPLTILLKGETTPVKKFSATIRSMRDDIIKEKKEVARPGAVKHFLSPSGKLQIKGIGADLGAVVEVSTQEEQKEEEDAIEEEEVDTAPYKKMLSGTIQGDKEVKIFVGDLTELAVDVIVNAANTRLNHGSGIAGAIMRKGGHVIQDDCTEYISRHGQLDVGDAVLMTNPGGLRCKAVVHAVGPIYHDQKEKSEGYIVKAVFGSIKQAESKNFKSIGFPAISTGIYSVPVDVCARGIFLGIEKFFKSYPTSNMKVVIMLYQNAHISAFTAAAHGHLKNIITHEPKGTSSGSTPAHSQAKGKGKPKKAQIHTQQKVDSSEISTLNRPIVPMKRISPSVVLKKAKLTDCKVDVYVNTAANNLDLSKGAVAKSLLKAGGKGLQIECTQLVNKKTNGIIDAWEIATTRGGKLHCQNVIHCITGEFGPAATQNLEDMIIAVMKECEILKAASVAFPAIGTGNLGFPIDVVAKVMVNTTSQYLFENKNTSIKKVILAVVMDDVHRVFEQEMKPAPPPHIPPSSFEVKPMLESAPSQVGASGDCILHTFKMDNLDIDIVHGDITNDGSEGLVNTTSEDLTLMDFGVQRAFRMKGGDKLQQECKAAVNEYGTLELGKVLVTGPGERGGLKCKNVLHILAPKKARGLTVTVEAILHKADDLGLKSVALPVIGTGKHNFTPSQASKYICQGIASYSANKVYNTSLRRIRIILFEKKLFDSFATAFEVDGKNQGILKWLAGSVASTIGTVVSSVGDYLSSHMGYDSSSVSQSTFTHQHDMEQVPAPGLPFSESAMLVIVVFADSKFVVNDVMKKVQQLIDENFIPDSVTHEKIDQLSDTTIEELEEFARVLHVKITIDKAPLNIIKLKGDRGDVQQLKTAVIEAIHKVELEEKHSKEADILMSKIRWQWKDNDNQFQDYAPANNIAIEDAFSSGQEMCTIYVFGDGGRKCFDLNLRDMKEAATEPPFTVTEIQRRDLDKEREDLEREKKEGERPKTWDPMPDHSKECYIVELQPGSPEYNEVEQAFSQSMVAKGQCPSNSNYPFQGVTKIERIQNPSLYGQYVLRKRAMDATNPEGHMNEQRLFHGCAQDAVDKINHQGFNRSFAGKNAAVLGRGVYFATTSEYSASDVYSVPNSNGQKFMYYARVLTGESTLGKKELIVPPPKDPNKPSILYDSVTSTFNNVFVVFQDAQSYPEYLITF
jgi:poly [ADP-ribose] polymerase 10/14/15